MPQAIAAIALQASQAIAGAVYSGLTAVGVSTATASLVSTYAASITAITVVTAAYVAPSLLFRPNIPDPEFARSIKKQAIPDRLSGYGRARIGGALMLYEARGNKALNVFAMHDGLIDGWETLYMNDQVETLGGGGFVNQGTDRRYGDSDLVQIDTRRGFHTESNYGFVTALAGDLWPSNATGDGIASMAMVCRSAKAENFLRDYPNGLPQPSRVGRLQICWDPRLGARGEINTDNDKEASPTWAWTENGPLQLLDYMTNPETGMGLPIGRFIPTIEWWMQAADDCDQLDENGAPLYRTSGTYLHSTPPADVIGAILQSFDGWMMQDTQGCFRVEAGVWINPTVTIEEGHIVALDRQFGLEDETAVNTLSIRFTDPAFDYTLVEADPWVNQADIDRRGVERIEPLELRMVNYNAQARRIAKITAARMNAFVRGTITTDLDGLRAWGERRIRIKAPSDGAVMADIVVEVLPIRLNADMTVTIPFVSADRTAYEFGSNEEGEGPGGDVRPDPVATPDPVILSANADIGTATITLTIVDPDRDDLSYTFSWRFNGADAWNDQTDRIGYAAGPDQLVIYSDGVGVGYIEYRVRAVSAGGVSNWVEGSSPIDTSGV